VPRVLGRSIPCVIGQTNLYLPSLGERYPGQRWDEPGDGHSTAWWRWTISF
jgi:hypothetical protein